MSNVRILTARIPSYCRSLRLRILEQDRMESIHISAQLNTQLKLETTYLRHNGGLNINENAERKGVV